MNRAVGKWTREVMSGMGGKVGGGGALRGLLMRGDGASAAVFLCAGRVGRFPCKGGRQRRIRPFDDAGVVLAPALVLRAGWLRVRREDSFLVFVISSKRRQGVSRAVAFREGSPVARTRRRQRRRAREHRRDRHRIRARRCSHRRGQLGRAVWRRAGLVRHSAASVRPKPPKPQFLSIPTRHFIPAFSSSSHPFLRVQMTTELIETLDYSTFFTISRFFDSLTSDRHRSLCEVRKVRE